MAPIRPYGVMTEEELAAIAAGQDVTQYPDGMLSFAPSGSVAGTADPLQSSAYADLIAAQQAKVDATRSALDAAQAKLTTPQDRAMSRDEGVASALLSLLPIGIGALVKGKEGAHIGSKVALGGLNSFYGNMDARDKEQREFDALNFKVAEKEYDSALDVLQKAQLGEAQADAVYDRYATGASSRDSRPLSDSEKQIALQLDPENGKNVQTKGDLDALIQKKRLEGDEATRKDNQEKEDRNNKESVRRLETAIKANRDENLSLNKFARSGFAFTSKPTEKEVTNASDLRTAYSQIQAFQQRLNEIYRKHGWSYLGNSAAEQEILNAMNIIDFKVMKNMGANFTLMEKQLSSDALGSTESLLDFVKGQLRGISPQDRLKTSMDRNKEAYVRGLTRYNAVDLTASDAYAHTMGRDPNTARLLETMGVSFGDDGAVKAPNFIDTLLSENEATKARLMEDLAEARGKIAGNTQKLGVTGQEYEPQAKPQRTPEEIWAEMKQIDAEIQKRLGNGR